jgi:glycerophosphoryl diester phosphodiesterase
MKIDTIKLSTGACRLVAHRGLSGLETENTCAAFLAAGLRRVWGIETDVHPTADGRFVCCHDADLRRVSGGTSLDVRKSALAEAQAVPLLDPDGATRRSDLRVPLFEDYLAICRKYDRVPVVELKDGPFDLRTVRRIAGLVREAGLLDRAVFIAFDWGDCLRARRACPDNEVMHLLGGGEPVPLAEHAAHRIGADYQHARVTPELVRAFHGAGLRVNAWIVDALADAARLLAAGVDLITTDILEEA